MLLTTSRARARSRRQRGLSLIEALITVLMLSLSALGYAALQLRGMSSNSSAMWRSKATVLTYEAADRMRANPPGVTAGNYNNLVNPGTAPTCTITSVCTAAQIATLDFVRWRANVAAALHLRHEARRFNPPGCRAAGECPHVGDTEPNCSCRIEDNLQMSAGCALHGEGEPDEELAPVKADPCAPTNIAALPDYWDARRAREGKPDLSRCGADLRQALASSAGGDLLTAEERAQVEAMRNTLPTRAGLPQRPGRQTLTVFGGIFQPLLRLRWIRSGMALSVR